MTREHQDREQEHEHIPHADGGEKAPEVSVETSEDAVKALSEFAQHGKGNAKDMPRLMRRISNSDKGDAALDFPALAKRVDGKLFLECCSVFGYWANFAVQLALDSASPAASGDDVRAYLRKLDISALLELDRDEKLITRLRQVMPKALALELPALAGLPMAMDSAPNLLRWYIDSTPVEVAAIELVRLGTADLARSLDTINRWDWLDHLDVGAAHAFSLRELQTTTNAKAKARISDILKGFPEDPMADKTAIQETARAEIDANLQSPDFSNEQVLDATARANGIKGLPKADLEKRMRGQPAADVLQFVMIAVNEPSKMMELLLTAPDVAPEHVIAVMGSLGAVDGRLEIIKNDKLRPKVRRVLGKSTSILDMFPDGLDAREVHAAIIKDEALATWALEMKQPRDSLWIAAGSAAGERRGLRMVKDDRGLDWISKLPADADTEQLRRLSFVVDGKYKKQVDKLIGDRPIIYDEGDWDAQELDPAIKNADDGTQFAIATYRDSTTEEDLMGRLADLEPDERAAVAKDPASLDRTLSKLSGDNLVRAVFQLQPTIAGLLGTKLKYETRLLSYLRTRPTSEEIDAASSAVLTARAAELFSRSPFIVFPALLEPSALAKAVGKNPKLLEWIFEAAEPNQALAVLSKEPAKAKAVEAMENLAEPTKRFPRYKYLLPEGKAGFDTIAKGVTDEETRDQVKDYQNNKGEKPDKEVADDGKRVHEAAKSDHLWHAINALEKPDPNTLLALVRAYPQDHMAILAGNHEQAITTLRENTFLGPQIVFPAVTPMQLIAFPNARNWLLQYEAPFVVRHLAAKDPGALQHLGKQIDAGGAEISNWLQNLPRGAGLDATERATLDKVRAHVKTPEGLRLLFGVRFDVAIEDTFDVTRTTDLWNALRRLPPAQVNQKVIEGFTRKDLGPTTPGLWADPTIKLTTDEAMLDGDDEGYENTPELTKAQIMRYYGLDEAGFTKALDKTNGFIEEVGSKYKVKTTHVRTFESTVLHEVGHSIDELLGERTELVFGIAGWKNHGIDQVEEWAKDMGALEGVSGKKREKIAEAWRHALRSRQPVKDLVPPDHPALDKDLAHVPLVKAALDGTLFHYRDKRQVGDRVAVTGTNQGTIATVPIETADIAPSAYSLSAPGEFFAECYVEYYRGYDGTKNTADKKGGNLPPAYRKWFDDNVDKIELNPDRYVKTDDSGGADAAPSQSASRSPKPKQHG